MAVDWKLKSIDVKTDHMSQNYLNTWWELEYRAHGVVMMEVQVEQEQQVEKVAMED